MYSLDETIFLPQKVCTCKLYAAYSMQELIFYDIISNAWFPFVRKCRERVKVADVIKYFYLCAVNNDRFEYRYKKKFTSGLFHIGKNDLFTAITIKGNPGLSIIICGYMFHLEQPI